VATCSSHANVTLGNVPGLVYFVRHDAAWSRREVVGGFELTCWRDGVELDRMVLDSARLDELFSRDD
jgi:hypothetical protein